MLPFSLPLFLSPSAFVVVNGSAATVYCRKAWRQVEEKVLSAVLQVGGGAGRGPFEEDRKMRMVLLGVALVGLVAAGANGALLFLAADDGGGKINLAPGDSDNMSLMLTIRDIDTGFAFANVFLNDDDDSANGQVDVTALTEGIGTVYDRSAFSLPADISHDVNNEYGLIMGKGPDGDGSSNWGPGTYTLDTLTLTLNGVSTSGTLDVTFEKGARQPQIFTADFLAYVWGIGFDGIIPDFADPGVGADDNPFRVNFIPEPASLALVAFGGLALLRRR